MKRTLHHVIGTTQWLGTCKFHIFADCPQLQKRRIRVFRWGIQDSTGAIHTSEYDASDRQICSLCRKREQSVNPAPT